MTLFYCLLKSETSH